ncbi:YeeE/YedE family protein [Azospirillaceae bacterium]
MRSTMVGLAAGVLFGVGLAVSGMTDPRVVLGFLDVRGDWNPALLFVLGGAVGITTLGYQAIFRRGRPFLTDCFSLPAKTVVDLRLVIGAVVFGVGWGLAGYCPGPALGALTAGNPGVVVFVGAMAAGVFLGKRL